MVTERPHQRAGHRHRGWSQALMATRARRALDKGAKRGHGCPTCTGDAGSAAHYSNAQPDSDGCPAPRAANEPPAAPVAGSCPAP